MINLKTVLRLVAQIQLIIVLFMVIPLVLALVYGETLESKAFGGTIGATILVTLFIIFLTRGEEQSLRARESYLLVTLTWVVAAAVGATPLYYAKALPTFPRCYFEIMSGLTTTGATALTNIEGTAKSILFWRDMTNWLGGMGIVVLFVAVLPFLGAKGTGLVSAESAGPTKDKLTPKIQQTAFALWSIYLALSILEMMLLLIGGLPLFDAVTVTFGTMGAAGFTPTNASIGSYNSVYVNIVATVFMVASSINFALYYKIITGKFKEVRKDSELRAYLSIILITALLITLELTIKNVYSFGRSLMHAFFMVCSIVSTTGFATVDYNIWPTFSKAILMLLFFVGGCAGSAGGGIKVSRIVAIIKVTGNTIKKRIHPRSVSSVTMNGAVLSDTVLLSIAGFIGTYILTGLVGTVVFALSGRSIETCFSTSFLLLGNIGIGFGDVSPSGNFSIFGGPLLCFGSFLMLAGRLELFTVYSLFAKSYWTK